MQTAMVLGVYAAALIIGGIYAYGSAPTGANAKTALIVPGVCAVLALVFALVASVGPAHYSRARLGWYGGIALTALCAAAFGMRAWGTTEKTSAYRDALGAYNSAVALDPGLAERERRAEFFRERSAPDHDPTYLRNTLWALSVLSVAALVTLLCLPEPLGPTSAARPIPKVLQSEEWTDEPPPDPGPLPPEERL